MTVGELIKILKQYPEDLSVLAEHDFWIYDLEEEYFEVREIACSEDNYGNYIDTEGCKEYYKPEEIFKALVIK